MLGFMKRRSPASPLYVAATYRGCENGWQPVGRPLNQEQAAQRAILLGRLFPDYIHRAVEV